MIFVYDDNYCYLNIAMISMIGINTAFTSLWTIFQCGGNNLLLINNLYLYVLMVKSIAMCSELKVVFGNVSQN